MEEHHLGITFGGSSRLEKRLPGVLPLRITAVRDIEMFVQNAPNHHKRRKIQDEEVHALTHSNNAFWIILMVEFSYYLADWRPCDGSAPSLF